MCPARPSISAGGARSRIFNADDLVPGSCVRAPPSTDSYITDGFVQAVTRETALREIKLFPSPPSRNRSASYSCNPYRACGQKLHGTFNGYFYTVCNRIYLHICNSENTISRQQVNKKLENMYDNELRKLNNDKKNSAKRFSANRIINGYIKFNAD